MMSIKINLLECDIV